MRRSEIISSPCGQYSKRVFKKQRWIVVGQFDESSAPIITAFCTREEAEAADRMAYRAGYQAHFILPASPASGEG